MGKFQHLASAILLERKFEHCTFVLHCSSKPANTFNDTLGFGLFHTFQLYFFLSTTDTWISHFEPLIPFSSIGALR